MIFSLKLKEETDCGFHNRSYHGKFKVYFYNGISSYLTSSLTLEAYLKPREATLALFNDEICTLQLKNDLASLFRVESRCSKQYHRYAWKCQWFCPREHAHR